jgi:DMSO/TMAO reductase YedYZ molybdopterin-dependent catalytic subunit
MLFEGNERKELEEKMRQEGRLPPRQVATLKWPVLHYGSVPRFDPEEWDFRVYGAVDNPARWSWREFNKLPKSKMTSDFHCVTRWSRFDNNWQGVRVLDLLKLVGVKTDARFVLVHAEQGYTANLPLEDLTRENVMLATHHDGKPLSGDHGYPLRLVVPHLYGWKSVKWVRGFELLEQMWPDFGSRTGITCMGTRGKSNGLRRSGLRRGRVCPRAT